MSVQVDCTGPPEPEVLQCPRTASSGRRLIVFTLGDSYDFLPLARSISDFICPSILPYGQCPPQLAQPPATLTLLKI